MNKVQYTKQLIENFKKSVTTNESKIQLNENVGGVIEALAAKYKIKPIGGKLTIKDFDGKLDNFSDRDLYDFCKAYADMYLQQKLKVNWDDIPNMMTRNKNPLLRAILDADGTDLNNLVDEIQSVCHDKEDALDKKIWYVNWYKGILAKKQPK